MSFAMVTKGDGTGRIWRECETIEIDNHGKKVRVRKLDDLEAKACISQEYGFEISAIKIEAPCWYEATDWNYFKFSVNGRWKYEVQNYEALKVIDWYE